MFEYSNIINDINSENLARDYDNFKRIYNLVIEYKYYKQLVLGQVTICELYRTIKKYKSRVVRTSLLIQAFSDYYAQLTSLASRELILNMLLSIANKLQLRVNKLYIYSREIDEKYHQNINRFVMNSINDSKLKGEHITWINEARSSFNGSLFTVDYKGYKYIFTIHNHLFSIIYNLYRHITVNLT